MCHIGSALSFQHQAVDLKTRLIQRCHAEFLRLLPLHHTRHSQPMAENGLQTCPVANTYDVFNDLLGYFSSGHEEHTLYKMFVEVSVN